MSKTFYRLGAKVNGAVYYYTGLGEFRSASDATNRCSERGAIVFMQRDLGHGLSSPEEVAICVGTWR